MKVQLCANVPSKNEIVDCEVFKKPNVEYIYISNIRNVSLGKLHRFISNVGIAPLTDHHGRNGDAFPCLVMYIYINSSSSSHLNF